MEPVTAIATATAAFSAIKKGFAVGRDIESMVSDLSRWMGALSDLDQAEREAKNPPIFKKLFGGKSVEQEALEAFAAKRKAQAQRDELKQWIGLTLGQSAWDELIKMEGNIRKQRQETIYKQREKRRKFLEIAAWTGFTGVGLAVLTAFVMLLMAHQAQASQLITCRKAGCDRVDGKLLCVYKGANNTTESHFFETHQHLPSEIQCEYNPNSVVVSIREVIKSIREAM